MPGAEIINNKEIIAINKLLKEEGAILIAHGGGDIRKKYHVREFEKNCSKFFKVKYCLAVSSGTAAIKIALKALGVKRGDEVITQAFNFIATVEAILDIGARPIIVNVNENLNMDPDELKKKITKKTKAVIPVHMLGFSCDMKKIINICNYYNLPILEDNCESVGATYNKKYLGTVGDIGVFSFDHGKILTTGEGGLILANKKKYMKYCREYHDHGHENNPRYPRGNDTRSISGFNYRMTEIQGVIGKEQLKKLNLIIKLNKERYKCLKNILVNFFTIRPEIHRSQTNYDTFIFFTKNKKQRNKALDIIKKNKFGTKNLPDALKWHCAYFWNHILENKQIEYCEKTFKILNTAIAIPINLKRSSKEYEKLAIDLSGI
jgi:8-amino-3,8-dideoxy-alpha-D-manno-octulosonate transaminase